MYIKINITFRFVQKFLQIQNEKKKFSVRSQLTFVPLATSTQIDAAKHDTLPKEQTIESVKHLNTNSTINLADSTVNDPMESTLKETSKRKEINKNNRNETIIKENDDRLNRIHFFLKNIPTSKTYFDVYSSILNMYPLIHLAITDHPQKIKYLCVAGNYF